MDFRDDSALDDVRIFALEASKPLAAAIGEALGVPVSAHEERNFDDGEHKARPLESVRDRDVFVIHSLYSDEGESVNDKLCKLLFFISALKDAGAERVTAVVPHLAYARKDRRTEGRDPVTTRYVAQLFEAAGVDRMVVMDVHNLAAFQNAFRCRTEHVEARVLFAEHLARLLDDTPAVIVSPDAGGVKRVELLRETLSKKVGRDLPMAFVEKKRTEDVVSGTALIGDVEGRVAIIVDDLISTGTTLVHAARRCRAHGAEGVWAVATHGLFSADAGERLAVPALQRVIVTNTVARVPSGPAREKLEVLDAAPLLAEVIRRLHTGRSLVELFSGSGELPATFLGEEAGTSQPVQGSG